MKTALLLMVLLFCFPIQAAEDSILDIRIEGIRNHRGEIGIAIFDGKKGFPLGLDKSYETVWIPLKEGMKTVTYRGTVPAGEYAVSVLHDENGNRKMDRSLLRFPREGVGFSNDQRVVLSAPKFKKCKFSLRTGEKKDVVIRLDYR